MRVFPGDGIRAPVSPSGILLAAASAIWSAAGTANAHGAKGELECTPRMSPGLTGMFAKKAFPAVVLGTMALGPSCPTTWYVFGPASLRKTFKVSCSPERRFPWVAEEVIEPASGTT